MANEIGRSVDYRLAERHMLWTMPMKDLMIYLYPRMFALHELSELHGTRTEEGNVILPPWKPLTQKVRLSPSTSFHLV